MEEMRHRVGRITNDLNALLNEITTVREGSELLDHVLTPEVIKGFKISVDAMRRLLWLYAETTVRRSSQASVDAQSLEEAREALGRSLHGLGGRVPLTWGTGSFIEKVEAIVEKRIPAMHEAAGQDF